MFQPGAEGGCRAEIRNLKALFPAAQGGLSSGAVGRWAEWEGEECFHCGSFLRHPGWRGQPSVFCASCTAGSPFLFARSLFVYEGDVRDGIRGSKYAGRPVAADALGSRLLEAVRGKWLDRFPDGFRPTVVPVPIRPLKYFRRGFNLPALVGSALARHAGWRFDPLALERTGEIRPQAGLAHADRNKNVRGAFLVPPDITAPFDALLLDDVYTSGATVKEAARALKTAGAENIVVLTVARTLP